MHVNVILTADGSHSLYDSELNEVYHSKFGAVNEARHVFINSGLLKITAARNSATILEIGFGTALNALLTCLLSKENKIKILYHAIEPAPLPSEIYKRLNYPDYLGIAEADGYF